MAIYCEFTLNKVFHALGDSTRRDMLSMLAKSQQLTATELAEPFDIAQPTASKHIKVLEQSALIERTIQGRTHYFQLKPDTLDLAQTWINHHRVFWSGSFNRLEQLIKAQPEDGEI